MYKYLPSKKFAIIFLSIILSLGIIFGFSFLLKPKTINIKLTKSETADKIAEFKILDTDNDGLKDWEEVLWKTDRKIADTDSDGTSDAEEISVNRDPLKPNTNPADQKPSDLIDPKIIAAELKAEEEFKNLTNTERMARELFSQYIATKNIGAQLTTTDQQNIVQNSIYNLPQITLKKYSKGDLQIVTASDNETLRIYTNAVAQILLTNIKIETEDLETIMTDLANISNDNRATEETVEIFKRLDPLINKNHNTVLGLVKLPVPELFINEHLNLLNSFQKIYEGLSLLQNTANDIVVAIPLVDQYETSVQELNDSLTALVLKISSSKVVFSSPADYGYLFFNVIMYKN